MKKKILAILAAMTMAAVTVAGCGGSNGSTTTAAPAATAAVAATTAAPAATAAAAATTAAPATTAAAATTKAAAATTAAAASSDGIVADNEADTPVPATIGSTKIDKAKGAGYHVGVCVLSLDNEFWKQETEGAKLAAAQYGAECDVLTCDSDANKQLQGIKDYIAKYGDKAVFVVDPCTTANTSNIAEICEESGNYCSIMFHRADGLFPKDFPHFVVSGKMNDYVNGQKTAKALFDSIGGKGKICEIQGLLGDDSSLNRHNAFNAMLKTYPGIEVQDSQSASWNQAPAMTLTENWIVKYPDLAAIYSSNDSMALGALEALKAKGLNGKVKLVGDDGAEAAMQAVISGDIVETIAGDGYLAGGYGAAFALQAAEGYLDVASVPGGRLFFSKVTFVTKDNAQNVIDKFIKTRDPGYDYTNLAFAVDKFQLVTDK